MFVNSSKHVEPYQVFQLYNRPQPQLFIRIALLDPDVLDHPIQIERQRLCWTGLNGDPPLFPFGNTNKLNQTPLSIQLTNEPNHILIQRHLSLSFSSTFNLYLFRSSSVHTGGYGPGAAVAWWNRRSFIFGWCV